MTNSVRSAARVLDLVELLSIETEGLSLTGIADRLSMPKSSTLMLLRTLVGRGYAHRTDGDRYQLAPDFRAGAFGWRTAPFANLLAVAQPILEALTEEVSESTTFGVLAGPGEARLLSNVVATVEVRWDSDINRVIPLYCTAVGRALLSAMPMEEQVRHLQAQPRRIVTNQTIVDLDDVLEAVARAQRDGFAVVAEEFALGGTGIAAPILGSNGELVAALNIGCVSSRFADKRKSMARALLMGKAEIEAGLVPVSQNRAA